MHENYNTCLVDYCRYPHNMVYFLRTNKNYIFLL